MSENIKEWMTRTGLGKYIDLFIENATDAALALARRQNAIAWIKRINAYHDSLQN